MRCDEKSLLFSDKWQISPQWVIVVKFSLISCSRQPQVCPIAGHPDAAMTAMERWREVVVGGGPVTNISNYNSNTIRRQCRRCTQRTTKLPTWWPSFVLLADKRLILPLAELPNCFLHFSITHFQTPDLNDVRQNPLCEKGWHMSIWVITLWK